MNRPGVSDNGAPCPVETIPPYTAEDFRKKAPVPGTGWGCVICGLASDGAIAACCDACAEKETLKLRWVFDGYMERGLLADFDTLAGEHEHDPAKHDEYERRRSCELV